MISRDSMTSRVIISRENLKEAGIRTPKKEELECTQKISNNIGQADFNIKLAKSVPILATSQAVQSFTITKPVLSNTLHLFHLANTA